MRGDAIGLSGFGGRAVGSAGLSPPAVLRDFEVWVDASTGLVNRGTDSAVSVFNDGCTDNGNHWDVPGAAQGIYCTGYTGDLTYPFTSGTLTGAETAVAFVAVDLAGLTGGTAAGRLFGHKGSTSSTVAGLQIHANVYTTSFEPRAQFGDGTVSRQADPNFDINGQGLVCVFMTFGWPFTNTMNCYIYRNGTQLATASYNIGAGGDPDITIADSGMAFFAGFDGTNAAAGVTGTRTLKGYAGGFTRGVDVPVSDLAAISRFYS